MSVEIKRAASRKTLLGTVSVTHYLNTKYAPYKVGKENAYPIYFWVTLRRTSTYRRSIIIPRDVCTPSQFYSREITAEIDREQQFILDVCAQYLADDDARDMELNTLIMAEDSPANDYSHTRNAVRAQIGYYLDYFARPLAYCIASDQVLKDRIMFDINAHLFADGESERADFGVFENNQINGYSLGGIDFKDMRLPSIESDEFKHLAERYAPDRLPCYELAACLWNCPQIYTIADALIPARRATMWRALIKTQPDQVRALIVDDSPTVAKLETAFADPLCSMLTLGDRLKFAPIE